MKVALPNQVVAKPPPQPGFGHHFPQLNYYSGTAISTPSRGQFRCSAHEFCFPGIEQAPGKTHVGSPKYPLFSNSSPLKKLTHRNFARLFEVAVAM